MNEASRFTLTAGILHALVREVRANGSELILPVIPKGWAHLDATEFRSDGVTLVDIDEDLERREVRYEHDSHMNPSGHALIARLLAPSVADHIRAHLARRHEAPAE
jgi:lysophospholipase L1-like esterase